MEETFNWPPLESNPEVMTDYMRKVGLPEPFQVGEIMGFDPDLLAFVNQPVYAVIANCERLKKTEDKAKGDESYSMPFYMKQTGTLDNACGLIACLHGALNSTDNIPLAEDSIMGKFKAQAAGKSPADRATLLEGFKEFQEAHISYANQGQSAHAESQDQVCYHFIAFVAHNGKLVELDGTKKGPVEIGECSDLLADTIKEIQKRLEGGEISERLSLMVINQEGEM